MRRIVRRLAAQRGLAARHASCSERGPGEAGRSTHRGMERGTTQRSMPCSGSCRDPHGGHSDRDASRRAWRGAAHAGCLRRTGSARRDSVLHAARSRANLDACPLGGTRRRIVEGVPDEEHPGGKNIVPIGGDRVSCLSRSSASRTVLPCERRKATRSRSCRTAARSRGIPVRRAPPTTPWRAQTTRFTTRFHDGTKAVAERRADGGIETKLEDIAGNEINRFNVGPNVLMYLRPSEDPVQAVPDPSVHITLDWSNRQSHRLHEDRVVSGAGLEWREGLMRHASARAKTRSARSSARSRPNGRMDCPRELFVSGRNRERRSRARPCRATSS